MAVSALEIFKIGIGPSSSHTVGPMVAARRFASLLMEIGDASVTNIRVELYGSLGANGKGHGTDKAVILGLMGMEPKTVDIEGIQEQLDRVAAAREIVLANGARIGFDPATDMQFIGQRSLPRHPNAMRLYARRPDGAEIIRTYYSIGGGFVMDEDEIGRAGSEASAALSIPFPFATASELLVHCRELETGIATIMWANECSWRTRLEIREELLKIWTVMQQCVARGCATSGTLPGGLKVQRRAPRMFQAMQQQEARSDHLVVVDWVNLFALAVNEENAAGGRVVTAPTNGAAGIVPAVLHYYWRFCPGASEDGVCDFLLTAAAIAILYKEK